MSNKAAIRSEELIEFCLKKECELHALAAARRQMASSWRTGKDADWREVAKTSGVRFIPSKRRAILALADDRIADRYMEEAATFADIALALTALALEAQK